MARDHRRVSKVHWYTYTQVKKAKLHYRVEAGWAANVAVLYKLVVGRDRRRAPGRRGPPGEPAKRESVMRDRHG